MEIWKDVSGYEGYYMVSDSGRIKSLKRPRVPQERILKPYKNTKGYFTIDLHKNKIRNTVTVHKLMAIAFLQHKPYGYSGLVVDHINNVRADNRLSNLQLISNRENITKDQKGGSSEYAGVYWDKLNRNWRAGIGIGHKEIHLGSNKTESIVANLYIKALDKLNSNEDYYMEKIHLLEARYKRAYLLG